MEESAAAAYNAFVLWTAGVFSLITLFKTLYPTLRKAYEFIFEKLGVTTKGMRKRAEDEQRLKNVETAIIEIKDTAQKNVQMFLDHEKQVVGEFMNMRNDIISELSRLNEKMVENQRENDETDCAMLRDRLNSAMRYFSQNVDDEGNVHISLADYETLDGLFQKYFSKHGNGAYKKAYKDFKNFIIDR